MTSNWEIDQYISFLPSLSNRVCFSSFMMFFFSFLQKMFIEYSWNINNESIFSISFRFIFFLFGLLHFDNQWLNQVLFFFISGSRLSIISRHMATNWFMTHLSINNFFLLFLRSFLLENMKYIEKLMVMILGSIFFSCCWKWSYGLMAVKLKSVFHFDKDDFNWRQFPLKFE